jgi:hypothetical protein
MKGTVFTLFEDFVVAGYGADAYEDVLASATLITKQPFVGPLSYPAEDLMSLVGAAVSRLDVPLDAALAAFGRFAFPVLARSIPGLMAELPDARSFLLRLESLIHTEVRKLDPASSPPRLSVIASDDTWVDLRYESPYGLFALVEGFLDGVAEWYGTPLAHERLDVRGTHATFRIHVSAPPPVPAQAARASQSPHTTETARATA